MVSPADGELAPGARFAMSVIHPGSPTLQVRFRQGVLVTPYGFPDWPLCARAVVRMPPPDPALTLEEQRVLDVLAANAAMARVAGDPDGDPLWPVTAAAGTVGGGREGAVPTPSGWCWAHVGTPDAARLLALVPIELHGSYRHAGGMRLLPATGRGLRADPEPLPVGPAAGEEVPGELLDLLESALGWPLPPAYRRFVGETNGAGPAAPAVLPPYGLVADQPLFGLAREDRHQDLSYVGEWVRDRLTVDFLPIGYVQGGLLAVKVSGDDLDSIWYLDDDDPRDREAYGPEEIRAHLLHRCADSVDDLWTRLVRPPAALVDLAARSVGQVAQVRDEMVGAGLPARLKAPWQPPAKGGSDPVATMFEASS
ncbi:HNH endonuclease [Phytohabitans sp. ZYX-F-186]|uniref:HNH endonuclease n=1 Tax=Phytohabitans maris TaxID=3071409 RepID=A0ABU0ZHM8_9ACTN|nr:SMI1/KNR4 family protein [Phytohabitans sp. ZYX-F-186]MDQ7906551.1 HNH endonuclease [Phytohabitans sp. ZYX-F-186]